MSGPFTRQERTIILFYVVGPLEARFRAETVTRHYPQMQFMS